jgi:hypothetical protein
MLDDGHGNVSSEEPHRLRVAVTAMMGKFTEENA